MSFLIGADPELFVKSPNSGKFVSGYGRIPGTKLNPHKVKDGAVQVDGMALEFNIDPAHDAMEFIHNIESVKSQLQAMVPGYNLVAEPIADFDDDVLRDQPADALELGCEPDYNAWTEFVNPRPNGNVRFRSGAGHIHIGWGEDFDTRSNNHFQDCVAVAKQMDYCLGIYSLLWDPDNRRRELYGKAGAFRVKPYGVEYRTMSNAWLRDPRLVAWVYHAAITGMEELKKGTKYFEQHGDTAQKIIDTNITDWPESHAFGIPVPTPPGLKALRAA